VKHVDTFVAVPGGSIFLRRWQPDTVLTDAPLILLHDSLGCVELWRRLPERLARRLGRPVLAYDRLGFGRSSERKALPTPDFIREEADVFFPAIRNELGIADFVLFGHSVGGAMSLLIASTMVDSCKAVVSESAQAFVEDRTITGIQRAKAEFQRAEQFERLRRWHGSKARWVLDAWTEVWLSPAFSSWSLASDLPLITCPALVIHGDEDEYGSARFPELISGRAGGYTEMHILEGCGHVPHRDREGTVIDLVAQFPPLSGVP
jgi:pimeloyl-ACP methyl ester carboxylesterase